MSNFRRFRSQNKLKKAAIHYIASHMDDAQIKVLREVFTSLDANCDGLLSINELKQGLAEASFAEIPVDLQQLLADVDSDGSGVIDYTEFLAASLDKLLYIQESAVWEAFQYFDQNGDGKISKEEIAAVLNDEGVSRAYGAQLVQELMQEIDTDADGTIDFPEFLAMMRGA